MKTHATILLLLAFAAQVPAQSLGPDPTFGINGVATVAPGLQSIDEGDIHFLPDGRILVVGTGYISGANSFRIDMFRLLPDGSFDDTFADTGYVQQVFSQRSTAGDSKLLDDGKILVAGHDADGNGVSQITPAIFRFNEDGSRDKTFNDVGMHRFKPEGSGPGIFRAVDVDEKGRIVAMGVGSGDINGNVSNGVMSARLLEDGTLDEDFGDGNGKSLVGNPTTRLDTGDGVMLEDGRTVLATRCSDRGTNNRICVIAQDDTAAVDLNFGDKGHLALPIEPTGWVISMDKDASGDVYIAYLSDVPTDSKVTIARLNEKGLVTDWGDNGTVVVKSGFRIWEVNSFRIVNERMYLSGYVGNEPGFAMVLTMDGQLDPEFNGTGILRNFGRFSTLIDFAPVPAKPLEEKRQSREYIALLNGTTYRVMRINEAWNVPNEEDLPESVFSVDVFPNPTSGPATLQANLDQASEVSIRVHDALGRTVRHIPNRRVPAGPFTTSIATDGLPSGTYFLTLSTDSQTATRSLLVTR